MRTRTTSSSATTNAGRSGYRWPLTLHHIPGRPSRKPGRRPMSDGGGAGQVGAVDGDEAERSAADPRQHRAVVGVDDPDPSPVARRHVDRKVALAAVDGPPPGVQVD